MSFGERQRLTNPLPVTKGRNAHPDAVASAVPQVRPGRWHFAGTRPSSYPSPYALLRHGFAACRCLRDSTPGRAQEHLEHDDLYPHLRPPGQRVGPRSTHGRICLMKPLFTPERAVQVTIFEVGIGLLLIAFLRKP